MKTGVLFLGHPEVLEREAAGLSTPCQPPCRHQRTKKARREKLQGIQPDGALTGPQTHPTPKSQLLPRDHSASRVRHPRVPCGHSNRHFLHFGHLAGPGLPQLHSLPKQVGSAVSGQKVHTFHGQDGFPHVTSSAGALSLGGRATVFFALSVVLLDDMMLQLSEARRQLGKRSEAQAYLPGLLSSKLPLRGCTLRPSPGTFSLQREPDTLGGPSCPGRSLPPLWSKQKRFSPRTTATDLPAPAWPLGLECLQAPGKIIDSDLTCK